MPFTLFSIISSVICIFPNLSCTSSSVFIKVYVDIVIKCDWCTLSEF